MTVAWHASAGRGVRAFAAMSTDNGATFGPPQQIDPDGAGNQVAPRLAATARRARRRRLSLGSPGHRRVQRDLGLGRAPASRARRPRPGATRRACRRSAPPATRRSRQLAPLGRRLGIATGGRRCSPLPATVVAFTDTSVGNQDVHVVGLLHGTTAPVIAAQTVTASKNVTTIVQVDRQRRRRRPAHVVGRGPAEHARLERARLRIPRAATFTFTRGEQGRDETFEAVATDGVPGHEARATITVSVVNDPPEIICSVLNAHEDEPLEVPASTPGRPCPRA